MRQFITVRQSTHRLEQTNSEGERITPSAVYFEEEEAGAIRVGLEAVNCRQLNPERAVRWIKRHMGDQDWKKDIDGRDWTPQEISSLILKKIKQDGSVESPIDDVVISVPAHFDEVRRKSMDLAGFPEVWTETDRDRRTSGADDGHWR